MTDVIENDFAEKKVEVSSVPTETEPVITFYRYDTDGFYLGTTWQSGENTTDIPLEYKSGYWYFFNGTDWDKVKIPESLSEITLDLTLTDESTNYQKTLVSLAQRLAHEYEGNDYRLDVQGNHYTIVSVSESDLQKEQYQQEITTLKKQLSATDYKAIKYAEGVLTDEEYQETGIQRQVWRARINELEELING